VQWADVPDSKEKKSKRRTRKLKRKEKKRVEQTFRSTTTPDKQCFKVDGERHGAKMSK
jgi:hypothetical protein